MNPTQKANIPQRKTSVSLSQLEKTVFRQFTIKFTIDDNFYNSRVINDIIFNSKSHIVSTFKNHLIFDDECEFLKRFYTKKESNMRLKNFFNFYETFSKIYPNYTSLIECKFIYKNIHKKQKMIDLQQQEDQSNKKEEKTSVNDKKSNEVFSTDVYNSIVNDNDDIALLFDLKNDDNDINDNNIQRMVDNISLLLQDEERLNLNHKHISNKDSISISNNIIDLYLKRSIMTPRVSSYYPSKINKLIPTKRDESSKEDNAVNSQMALNGSQRNIFKHIRNEKSKLSNSSLSSCQKKNNLSTTLSQKKQQAPSQNNKNSNNNSNNNINNTNYIKFNPVSCCEDELNLINSNGNINISNRESNNNSNSKQCNYNNINKGKVSIRFIKGSETMRLKNHILSQIHDSHSKFFLQSISKINQVGIKLGNRNNDQQPLFSPQITKRNNNGNKECGSLKDILYNNTVHNSKASLSKSKTKTDRRIGNYSNNIIKIIGKSEYMKKRPRYNNSHKSNNLKQSPGNINEISINTTRPQSRSKINQLNYANKKQINCNPHLEEKKEIPSCSIAIGQPFPNSSIKQIIKGIQIKNFNKALGLNNNNNNHNETPLRKICTERIRSNNKRGINILKLHSKQEY